MVRRLVRFVTALLEVDVRRWRWMIAFLLVASACGGGDSGGDTATTGVSDVAAVSPEDTQAAGGSPEGVSVTSSDGIVTVEVPAGAAPDGVTVTVDAGDPASLPQELRDSGLPVFVYELGPDGTQFAEPVMVTFRIPAAVAGFDPAVGMPMAVLASRSGEGLLDLYASVDVSLAGDVLVVSGSTDHFTQAVVVLSGVSLSLVTRPSPVKVGEGQIFHALVSNFPDYEKAVEASGENRGARVLYRSKAPVTSLRLIDDFIGEFRCDGETDGVLPDAITAEVRRTFREFFRDPLLVVRMGTLNIFGNAPNARLVAIFHADVECTEDDTTTTTTTQSPAPEELQAAMPVTVTNNGNGQIDIEFAGNVRVFTLTLIQGGVVHRFDVTVHVFGEGGLRVTGNVRTTDGETVVDGRSVQDAGPTDDGKGVKTVTESAEVVWELIDDNHVRITITPIEGVTWPDTTPQWTVLVQKTSDSPAFTFSG